MRLEARLSVQLQLSALTWGQLVAVERPVASESFSSFEFLHGDWVAPAALAGSLMASRRLGAVTASSLGGAVPSRIRTKATCSGFAFSGYLSVHPLVVGTCLGFADVDDVILLEHHVCSVSLWRVIP